MKIINRVLLALVCLMPGCDDGTVIKKGYYDDGSLEMEVEWANDTINGSMKTYYRNGGLRFVGHYLEGARDGEFKWFSKSGSIVKRAFYKEGVLDGKSINYFEDGTIKSAYIVEDGDTLRYDVYNSKGKTIKTYVDFTKVLPDSLKN